MDETKWRNTEIIFLSWELPGPKYSLLKVMTPKIWKTLVYRHFVWFSFQFEKENIHDFHMKWKIICPLLILIWFNIAPNFSSEFLEKINSLIIFFLVSHITKFVRERYHSLIFLWINWIDNTHLLLNYHLAVNAG